MGELDHLTAITAESSKPSRLKAKSCCQAQSAERKLPFDTKARVAEAPMGCLLQGNSKVVWVEEGNGQDSQKCTNCEMLWDNLQDNSGCRAKVGSTDCCAAAGITDFFDKHAERKLESWFGERAALNYIGVKGEPEVLEPETLEINTNLDTIETLAETEINQANLVAAQEEQAIEETK